MKRYTHGDTCSGEYRCGPVPDKEGELVYAEDVDAELAELRQIKRAAEAWQIGLERDVRNVGIFQMLTAILAARGPSGKGEGK